MDFGVLLPERSMEDILAERIPITFKDGEVVYLPVLAIPENRDWKARMDLELGFLLVNLAQTDDGDAIAGLFDGSEALFLDLLTSYDTSGVLGPPDTIEARMTPLGLVRAVLEVWRAARPLADIAATGLTMGQATTSASPPRMSSWLRNMAGRLRRSTG